MNIKNKLCKKCNKKFKPKGCNQKYCDKCKYVELKCVVCNNIFKIKRSRYNQGRGKKCLKKCVYSNKHYKEYFKKYRQRKEVKEKKKIFIQNYRAKKYKNGGIFIKEEWKYIMWLYNYKCAICQIKTKLTIDHIIPISKEGKHCFDNIQPLCLSCNCSKQDK